MDENPLDKYRVNPEDFRKIDDGDFDTVENSVVHIYLVEKKANPQKKYVKKEFVYFEDNENEDKGTSDDSEISIDKDIDDDDIDLLKDEDSDCNITSSIKYFEREVKNLIKVQIKGFPFLRFIGFNYQTSESYPFILTKRMKGNTLEHLIVNKFEILDPNTTKMIIFYGVAFALKILHKMEIIHRDIKPANIFLNEKNEPFLGDFGFARLIQESPKLTENVGTSYYMAKELYSKEADPKDRIDSYSFAVTVLETITLDLTIKNQKNEILSKNNSINDDLLDQNTVKELIKKGAKYIIPDDVTPEFRELIKACLSKEAEERWSMEIIVDKMEKKELFLPGCNETMFFEYVNKLKEAEKKDENININDDDDDEEDDAKKKVDKKARLKKKVSKKHFKPTTTPA